MKSTFNRLLLLSICMTLVACQNKIDGVTSSGDNSRYAEEQPRDAYLNTPAYINVQLAIEYMKQQDFAIALSKLKKALLYNPNLAIAHTTIAVLYEEIGENNLAEKHYEKSIALDGNDARLRNNYGQYLCRNNRQEAGIEQFKIAAANPLYATPYIPLTNAGACSLAIGNTAQAETFYRRALKKQPNLPPALLNMMNISLDKADYMQARAYLQRYLDSGKHNAATLWAGSRIETQLGDKEAAANYAVRLKSRFPDSDETRQLLQEISNR